MFEAFDTLTTLFLIAFFLILGLIIFTWIMSFTRALRSRKETPNRPAIQNEPVITQKEIIREVVKVRFPYCHGLYDEMLDACPHCGAKNSKKDETLHQTNQNLNTRMIQSAQASA